MKNPCFNRETRTDYPKRKGGCAVDCPEWAKYVEERDAEYKRRQEQAEIDRIIANRRDKAFELRMRRDVHYKRSHRSHTN